MYHFNICYIYTNISWWFVIINERYPRACRLEDVLAEQAPKEHGATNIEDQVNDHIEEDDHTDNIVKDEYQYIDPRCI